MKYSLSLSGEIFFPENIEDNINECNNIADNIFDDMVEIAEKNNCEILMSSKVVNNEFSQQFSHYSIYRHFKGKYYVTIDKSIPIDSTELKSLIDTKLCLKNNYSLTVQHTEKKKIIDGKEAPEINTVYCIDGKWYHDSNFDTQELSLYKALYNNEITYARPLSMFLSPVDKEKHPNAFQEFRFEKL